MLGIAFDDPLYCLYVQLGFTQGVCTDSARAHSPANYQDAILDLDIETLEVI